MKVLARGLEIKHQITAQALQNVVSILYLLKYHYGFKSVFAGKFLKWLILLYFIFTASRRVHNIIK